MRAVPTLPHHAIWLMQSRDRWTCGRSQSLTRQLISHRGPMAREMRRLDAARQRCPFPRQEPLMQPSRYSAVCAKALGACAAFLVLLHACREADRPTAPIEARSVISGKVALFYVCDNKFRSTNANPSPTTVTYQVVNTADHATMNLP